MPGTERAGRRHRLVEALPALVGHRADAELERIARLHDALLVHHLERIGDLVVGHVGIVFLDRGIRRVARRAALHVFGPAFQRRVDEALHHVLLLLGHLARDVDGRVVVVEARVRDQVHHRLHARLHDHVGLGRQEPLLRKLLVGEERRHVEGVGPRLLVGEAELGLEERPVADCARRRRSGSARL